MSARAGRYRNVGVIVICFSLRVGRRIAQLWSIPTVTYDDVTTQSAFVISPNTQFDTIKVRKGPKSIVLTHNPAIQSRP